VIKNIHMLVVSYFLCIVIQVDALAQDILLNEIMTSNTNSYFDEFENTPDWIEIFNTSAQSVNLNSYSLTDSKTELQKWTFPSLNIGSQDYLLIAASGRNIANSVSDWETVITKGDNWKYFLGYSEPNSNWREVDFEDSLWETGESGVGYGDGDDQTQIDQVSALYLRKSFTIDDTSQISKIMLNIDFDDGYVAYLNGIEISRANLGEPAEFIPFTGFADDPTEARLYRNEKLDVHFINDLPEIINNGKNILSIQMHNVNSSSSDLTAIPFLTIGYNLIKNDSYVAEEIKSLLPILHTNFSLSNGNETLYLVHNNQIVDSAISRELPENVSYGRSPNGSSDWYLFDNPTPGEPNLSNGYIDNVEEPKLNYPSGFYANPVIIELQNPTNSITYYTLDSSEPDTNASKFTSPLTINSTSVIKLRSYSENKIPSSTITSTYFINENQDLPVISLSTNPDNLWDYYNGIYVLGPNAESSFPYFGANFWQDWEKSANIEFFETNSLPIINSSARIKIFGGWSRGNDQKSIAIFPDKTINQKIFPQLDIDKFKSVVLRNSGNDWNSTMLRDGFVSKIAEKLNIDNLSYRPAELFLNSEYWGIHNIREKLNLNYITSHYDVNKSNINLLESNGNIIDGNNEEYLEMINFLNSKNLAIQENYKIVESFIDIPSFIDYYILQIYIANTDWPGNNNKFWKISGTNGKWRWILFDTDFGFGWIYGEDYRHNTLGFALEENGPAWPNPPWSTFIFRKLLENQGFKNSFITRFSDLVNTVFKPEKIKELLLANSDVIESSIAKHANKWNQFSFNQWQNNIITMQQFADLRIPYLKIHFKNEFNISDFSEIDLNLSNENSGKIKINSIIPDQYPWKGDYFINSEIVLTAIPNPGYEFIGWSGAVNSPDSIIEIITEKYQKIIANFSKRISYQNIVINEINYNSSSVFDTKDWVELYNNSDEIVDISGWQLKDENDSNVYVIPQNITLDGKKFLVVCRDATLFNNLHLEINNFIGDFNFGLNNSGDLIRLFDKNDILIDSVRYDDNLPWPKSADGDGNTLELINPDSENSFVENWSFSENHGTPGEVNGAFLSSIVNQTYIPEKLELVQNYPNPFNPATSLQYTLPNYGHTTLIVYDILGRQITKLVDEKQEPGIYTIQFDGSNLGSGVYIYQLKSGSKNFVKKMILLK